MANKYFIVNYFLQLVTRLHYICCITSALTSKHYHKSTFSVQVNTDASSKKCFDSYMTFHFDVWFV